MVIGCDRGMTRVARGWGVGGVRTCVVVAVVVGGWVVGVVPAAGAAVGAMPNPTFVTDGPVFAVARTADRLYLGGSFSQVGPRTGPWAAVSASSGSFDPAMPEVSGGGGVVSAIVSDGSGGFFIGGDFTHVGGIARQDLAHIRADKSVDPGWAPSVNNGGVAALAVSGSTVYIGGGFTAINGSLARNNAAAVDASTGAATAWNPDLNNPVLALAVSGSTVYLGGTFGGATAINGSVTRNSVAAVDASTGTATAWNPNVNNWVFALAVSGSTVYLGGDFFGSSAVNGSVTRNFAAAVDASTGTATAWDPNASSGVRTLAVSGSTVYLGGLFNGANAINGSLTRNYAAAVDASTGTATGWDPNVNNVVRALAVSGPTVYLGGDFSGANAINGSLPRNHAAAVDASTGTATPWDPNANSIVSAFAVSGPTVYVGGSFSSLDGQRRNNVAALNAADGTLTAWDPNANGAVDTLAVSGSTVYLGGLFSGANAINGSLMRNHAAAVDASTGTATAWNPNANNAVLALGVSGSTVYLGGLFSGANAINGSLTRNHAAAVDASTGTATAWDPNVNRSVLALAVSGSTVYLGGDFNSDNAINGSVKRNFAAAVDASTGTGTGWDPNANNSVLALAVSGSTVYLGGYFVSDAAINGSVKRNYAAAVDASTGTATAWNPNANNAVRALAVSGSTVYLGGNFSGTNAINGSLTRNYAAAVDASTGTATPWDPNADHTVSALTVDGAGNLLMGGAFNTLDLGAQQGVASFSEPAGGGDGGTTSGGTTSGGTTGGATTGGAPPIGDGSPPAVPAAVRGLTLAPNSFFAAPSGPSRAARALKRTVGTRVTYTLNQPAVVRFTVQQTLPGRKTATNPKARCKAPTKHNRKAKLCTRIVTLRGSFTQNATAGTNHFQFTGRLAGKKLQPGNYTLVAIPTTHGTTGRSATARFRIKA
jgi:hypothetical protein